MKTETEPPLPESARGHDVFVSYSRADRERVVELTQALAARGKRAWVDLEDIPPSAEWMAEIRSAIESADGYLVVVSPALAGSKVCAEELEHARVAGKRIVPVLVRSTDPDRVPKALSALNWIDATGRELGRPLTGSSPPWIPTSSTPGPTPGCSFGPPSGTAGRGPLATAARLET